MQRILLEQMTAGIPDTKSNTITLHFSNDDVDKYLEMLDRYENRPSKKLILVT